MASRPASIKVRALQWLAQREHSRSELRGKLLRLLAAPASLAASVAEHEDGESSNALLGTPAGKAPADAGSVPADAAQAVDALLDWLEARGYLSSQRFVESRVHARQQRYGNLRIQRELQQHGLSLDRETRQSLAGSEFERAQAVWARKYGAPADDPAGRVRQMRFLAGRGFSADIVRRVVRGGGHDDGEAPP